MTNEPTESYVYVYIDPRNFEEFYYGKGIGNRKRDHLSEDNDSEKSKRIRDIINAGQKPIVRVIARNLTDKQALLVEKTLIWKLGKNLTNISGGHFANNFRQHNTFHQDLFGYDFKNGIFYVNVGQGMHRCWDDCKQFGFLSAGQHKKYSDPLRTLETGDIVVAYLKRHGYVGVGRVTDKAIRIDEFKLNGKSLRDIPLKTQNMFDNYDNEKSEYLIKVDWIKSVESAHAKKARKKDGIYSTTLIKASLQGQPKTIEYIEREFEIKLSDLMLSV